eukprot:scaffold23998_cov20-Tisochrysis_lutea.AAC.3
MVGAALQCCMPAAPAAAAAAAAERPQWERLCCLHLPAHHPHTCCQRFCSAWLVQRGVSHSHRGCERCSRVCLDRPLWERSKQPGRSVLLGKKLWPELGRLQLLLMVTIVLVGVGVVMGLVVWVCSEGASWTGACSQGWGTPRQMQLSNCMATGPAALDCCSAASSAAAAAAAAPRGPWSSAKALWPADCAPGSACSL